MSVSGLCFQQVRDLLQVRVRSQSEMVIVWPQYTESSNRSVSWVFLSCPQVFDTFLQSGLTETLWKMPSLRSCGPPPSDEETSVPQSPRHLLQLLLPSPPPAALSIHPSLPSSNPRRKRGQKPCPNHRVSSSHHSHHHCSYPLTPQRSDMQSARIFEVRAPQPCPVSHQLDHLLWFGSAAVSV